MKVGASFPMKVWAAGHVSIWAACHFGIVGEQSQTPQAARGLHVQPLRLLTGGQSDAQAEFSEFIDSDGI